MAFAGTNYSNAITPDIKDKRGEPLSGVKAQSREVSKSMKYQELCLAVGMSFMPIVIESQGLAGGAAVPPALC